MIENTSSGEENEEVIINPYNFNNQLISQNDVEKILMSFDIDLCINDITLYQKAFIHKSYTKKDMEKFDDNVSMAEKPEGALELFDESYERLEFLGDAVINLIIGKYLYERYSTEDEGFMTRMRTKLVNGATLCHFAKELNFGKFVIISRHVEDKCNGRTSLKILEDSFEAFFGAMLLDFNEIECNSNFDFYSGYGFNVCENFLINLIEEKVDFSKLILNDYNYKDQLLRYFQQTFHYSPKYSLILSEGPPNDRKFTVGVIDNEGNILAEGKGKSKKKAEQKASLNTLIKFKVLDEDMAIDDDEDFNNQDIMNN